MNSIITAAERYEQHIHTWMNNAQEQFANQLADMITDLAQEVIDIMKHHPDLSQRKVFKQLTGKERMLKMAMTQEFEMQELIAQTIEMIHASRGQEQSQQYEEIPHKNPASYDSLEKLTLPIVPKNMTKKTKQENTSEKRAKNNPRKSMR